MKSMMKKTAFAAIFFAFAMFVAAPLAQATTVSEVQSMINQLKGKVQIINISGKNAEIKDRPGLLGQLDGVFERFAGSRASFDLDEVEEGEE